MREDLTAVKPEPTPPARAFEGRVAGRLRPSALSLHPSLRPRAERRFPAAHPFHRPLSPFSATLGPEIGKSVQKLFFIHGMFLLGPIDKDDFPVLGGRDAVQPVPQPVGRHA